MYPKSPEITLCILLIVRVSLEAQRIREILKVKFLSFAIPFRLETEYLTLSI